MTDRVVAYLVSLDRDVREDDAQVIISALRMVKGVAAVEPLVGTWEVQKARMDADQAWRKRLLDLMKGELDERT